MNKSKCNCLDGAYDSCEVCSPKENKITKEELYKSMKDVKKEVESWPEWLQAAMGFKVL